MTPRPGYPELKAFLRFFSAHYLDARHPSADDRPMAVLERHEQLSVKDAESALRMAVNNCLEISSSWPLVQVQSLDADMHAAGIPSLSRVRSSAWGRYAALLKRGALRSDDESVVAKGVLADPSLVPLLPASERAQLQAMVQAWAQQRARPAVPMQAVRAPRRDGPGRR